MDRGMDQDIELTGLSLEADMDAVLRVWAEGGWFEGEADQEKAIRRFFEANDGRSLVGRIEGAAESVVHRSLGTMFYEGDDGPTPLSLGGITAVTTSRLARRLGLASRLTARSTAMLADEGAAVALLGMFEQGFYDRCGYATGSYEHRVRVYPGDLNVPVPYRRPSRFDLEADIEEIHDAVVNRMPWHGGIVIGGERLTLTTFQIDYDVTVFGYRTDGALSHFIAMDSKGENGPDRIVGMAYQNRRQCLELLRLIQEWGDQVDAVRLVEPPWLNLQTLMQQPGHEARRTKGTANPTAIDADAWWQLRILDLDACLQAMRSPAEAFSVTVDLSDPIESKLLDSGYDGSWEPLTGRWELRFGPTNSAHRVAATSGPADLETSVNALSQWWIGSVSAMTQMALGHFDTTDELARKLDGLTSVLPLPAVGWNI